MTSVARHSPSPVADVLDWLESGPALGLRGFGLAPYAVFGATLGRTSTAHFSAELRAYQNVIRQTIKVGPPDSNGDRAEEDVFPTELGAFVGIWW